MVLIDFVFDPSFSDKKCTKRAGKNATPACRYGVYIEHTGSSFNCSSNKEMHNKKL